MSQKGFAHIFLIFFLLAGLAVAIYLVQQKTNILPKAYQQNRIGIGSTAPIGIGSTAPIGVLPAKPYNLKGICYSTPGYGSGTTAIVNWTPGNIGIGTTEAYFVRYKQQLPETGGLPQYNSWWPSDPSDGANIFPGLQLAALPGQKFEVWGVYACNLNGCTDFVRGEAFDCLNPIPTQANTLDYVNATVPEWGANMTAPIPQD